MAVKSRLIYTAGTFAINAELAVCRRLVVTASTVRKPTTQLYQNERSNPPKGFLGYVGLFINSYCVEIKPLEFDPQVVLFWDNPAIQLYYSVLCTGANIVDALVALGLAMTPPAILLPTTPDAAPFSACPFTILKFKLLAGVRIQVDGFGEEVVACEAAPVNGAIPNLPPAPNPYPPDQAPDEDPPRSLPEEGELPGDTAPVTPDDPESSPNLPGIWLLTYTLPVGTTTASYPGNENDVFEIVSPSPLCALSGSSRLLQNGVVIPGEDPFNCNNTGFVSSIVSTVFTPS